MQYGKDVNMITECTINPGILQVMNTMYREVGSDCDADYITKHSGLAKQSK